MTYDGAFEAGLRHGYGELQAGWLGALIGRLVAIMNNVVRGRVDDMYV